MRGSPLLRAALTFLVLLSLAPVLWQMTRPAGAVAPPVVIAEETKKSGIHLELSFTTPPTRAAVFYLGQEVWKKDAPEASEEFDLSLVWPAQGGELVFKIDWPAGAPLSAMRARLTDPLDTEIERSAWGRGPVQAVLGFP